MKRKFALRLVISICTVCVLLSCTKVHQPLTVAQIFTDHMVLQANKPICLWGKATSGTTVSVTVRNQAKKVKVDVDGNWKLYLDAEGYGENSELRITSGKEEIILGDILFGEVWICSGQSNMEMPMVSNWAHVNNVDEEVKYADYPEIRLFTVNKNIAFHPIDTIATLGWQVCTPENIKDFSATAYFYGRFLHTELNVPIGLVHSSWGGTVAEAWTSNASLLKMPDFSERAQYIASLAGSRDSLQRRYDAETTVMNQEINEADEGFNGDEAIYTSPYLVDDDWFPIDLPKMWEETELGVYDGSTWFRKHIILSKEQTVMNWVLQYGAPDDWDEAWVNGVKVGENKEWNILREYAVPAGIFKEGNNVITLRVYDFVGGGGFMGEANQFKLISGEGDVIPIAEDWLAHKGFDFKDINTIPVSLNDPNQPTVLYNAMINPIINYTFQGAIWYQGESNAGRAHQYQGLFKNMILDWRSSFNNGDFPFYFVQLANYLQRSKEPVEDSWAELREAQTMALELPNTGMAVAIDIGDALDIHPGNKQDVGKRLAINALAKTYEKAIDYCGPMYKSFKVNNKFVEITFDYDKQMQTSDGEPLTGFSIAGEDGVFVWANAEIVESKVLVWSPNVKTPYAVRYAWSSNPECNLTNNTGLPASPFRTDTFKGITEE